MKISVFDLQKIVQEELQDVVEENILLREGVHPDWTPMADPEGKGRTCYDTPTGTRCTGTPAQVAKRSDPEAWGGNWWDPLNIAGSDAAYDRAGTIATVDPETGLLDTSMFADYAEEEDRISPAQKKYVKDKLRGRSAPMPELTKGVDTTTPVGPPDDVDDSGGGGGGGAGGGERRVTPGPPGPPTEPGGDVIDPEEKKVIWHGYRDDDGKTVFVNTETGEEQFDCPEHLDCEAAEEQLNTLYPADADEDEDGEGEEPVEEWPVCQNQDILNDAYEMYEALEGWGTDEDAIYEILHNNSGPECILALYQSFEDVLERMNETDDGDLITWLKDDGEDGSAKYIHDTLIQMIEKRS